MVASTRRAPDPFPPGRMGGMLDHLSIQCADVAASAAFYDTVLAPLGGAGSWTSARSSATACPPMPDFWLGPRSTGEGFRESHIAFTRAGPRRGATRSSTAAVGAGAEVLHEPRVWPEYHPNYYGAFVRDPDGNNVEAVCHPPG